MKLSSPHIGSKLAAGSQLQCEKQEELISLLGAEIIELQEIINMNSLCNSTVTSHLSGYSSVTPTSFRVGQFTMNTNTGKRATRVTIQLMSATRRPFDLVKYIINDPINTPEPPPQTAITNSKYQYVTFKLQKSIIFQTSQPYLELTRQYSWRNSPITPARRLALDAVILN